MSPKSFMALAVEWRQGETAERWRRQYNLEAQSEAGDKLDVQLDCAEQLEALIREWAKQTNEGFLDLPAELILGTAEAKP